MCLVTLKGLFVDLFRNNNSRFKRKGKRKTTESLSPICIHQFSKMPPLIRNHTAIFCSLSDKTRIWPACLCHPIPSAPCSELLQETHVKQRSFASLRGRILTLKLIFMASHESLVSSVAPVVTPDHV